MAIRRHQFQLFVSRPNGLFLPLKTALSLVPEGAGKEEA
jgi:hypothetical protein